VNDHVDKLLEKWKKERPDLDTSPVAIIGRLGRLMLYIEDALETIFSEFGLNRASWDVLATLRRCGAPYRLSQRALLDSLMRSSGTISLRIDRMQEDGLVTREPDPDDRRSVLVSLTQKGLSLFEQVAPLHLNNEAGLVSGLTKTEQSDLASLLRKLLSSLEIAASDTDGLPVLGILVHSAAESRRMRRAVGLDDRAGILIKDVQEGSAAERAGLAIGDLIVDAANNAIRSWIDLRRATAQTRDGAIELSVLRGTALRRVRVQFRGLKKSTKPQ